MIGTLEYLLGVCLVVWLVFRTVVVLSKKDLYAHARTVLFLGGLWVLAIGFWSARWQ